MSGVSDIAMRSIARQWGSDLTFSEFISTDALYYKVKAWYKNTKENFTDKEINDCLADSDYWQDDKSFVLAKFIPEERPFIIQVFCNNPEHFKAAVKILNQQFQPDGFDVNFGCPARSVINNGAGSCLFLQPEIAKQIIIAVKETSGNLPTSIKLRASYKHVTALEFLKAIEGAPFENVTLHMRSYEQVHHGEPNWDTGSELEQYLHPKGISLIVNGGIDSGTKAMAVLEHTEADGVMVAQASLGNPFIFRAIKHAVHSKLPIEPSWEEKISTIMRHAHLMLEHKGQRGIIEMRKHLLWYFKGFPNASALRQRLGQVNTISELEEILETIILPSPNDVPDKVRELA
jgi:tRNA-dihydrouridine synthase B